MIRIAICNKDTEEGLQLRGLIDRYALKADMKHVEPYVTNSCVDLQSLLFRVKPDFFDMAICRVDLMNPPIPREEKVEMMAQLMEWSPHTHFLLISNDPEDAMCSFDVGAKFLQLPVTLDGFMRTIGKTLDEIALDHKRPFAAKSVKGTVTMNLNDITFVETNKKGPIIHLPDTRTVMTRGTLQALYEQLSKMDSRFIRAGGSFIVNLDNVRSIGESTIVFGDGETIILPTRARKPVRDAYTAFLRGV